MSFFGQGQAPGQTPGQNDSGSNPWTNFSTRTLGASMGGSFIPPSQTQQSQQTQPSRFGTPATSFPMPNGFGGFARPSNELIPVRQQQDSTLMTPPEGMDPEAFEALPDDLKRECLRNPEYFMEGQHKAREQVLQNLERDRWDDPSLRERDSSLVKPKLGMDNSKETFQFNYVAVIKALAHKALLLGSFPGELIPNFTLHFGYSIDQNVKELSIEPVGILKFFEGQLCDSLMAFLSDKDPNSVMTLERLISWANQLINTFANSIKEVGAISHSDPNIEAKYIRDITNYLNSEFEVTVKQKMDAIYNGPMTLTPNPMFDVIPKRVPVSGDDGNHRPYGDENELGINAKYRRIDDQHAEDF